jgi:hypothetical protein
MIALAFACPWRDETDLTTTGPARLEAICTACDAMIVPELVIPGRGVIL